MKDLTEKQRRVLEFIKNEVSRCNYPPSVREICDEIGFRSSSTAHAYLEALQEKGYIRRDPAKPRAISLLRQNRPMPGIRCRYAPVIGRITAGQPILAKEHYQGYLPLPEDLSVNGELFVLQVEGESMRDAGILHGDLAIVRRQSTAENGQIVVALLQEEATIKRFYREHGTIRLQPDNEQYPPIITSEVTILGLVVGIFRKL
ncbi:MAG TPA: transcriptional repressor LexA [Firmicutes bacterium]|nr:transcriptional repressor LexA [Bacillota bacterium]